MTASLTIRATELFCLSAEYLEPVMLTGFQAGMDWDESRLFR